MNLIFKDECTAFELLKIYDSANWLYNDDRWKGSLEAFEDLIKSNQILLACDEFSAIGFLAFKRIEAAVIVTGLYVAKEYQGKGVATLLFSEFNAKNVDLKTIAEVVNGASWAIDFYKKHGFELIEPGSHLLNDVRESLFLANGTSVLLRHVR